MRPKTRKAVDDYLQELLAGSGVEARRVAGRGRCLFATRKPSGEPPLVFIDNPLGGAVQAAPRTKPGFACALCGHALGSPADHVRRLLGDGASKLPAAAEAPPDSVLEESVSDVRSGRPLFAKGRRPSLCGGRCLAEYDRIFQPLFANLEATRRFARHAKKTDCVFYMLALKLICWALAEFRRTGDACRAAAPLRALHGRPFWDAVEPPESPAAAAQWRERMQKDTERSRLLALEALKAAPLPAGWPFLEPRGYAHLLGSLCCNAIAVAYASPLVSHVLQVDACVDGPERRAAMAELEPFVRALQSARAPGTQSAGEDSDSDSDAADGKSLTDDRTFSWDLPSGRHLSFSTSLFPWYKGYAVFPRLSLANHSCDPTCGVEFTWGAAVLLCAQPTSTVSAGGELTISYLDASLGTQVSDGDAARQRRQRFLRPYGFVCSCPKCGAGDREATPSQGKRRRRQQQQQRRKEKEEVPREPQDVGPAQAAGPAPKQLKVVPLIQEPCPACDGSGDLLGDPCSFCEGTGQAA